MRPHLLLFLALLTGITTSSMAQAPSDPPTYAFGECCSCCAALGDGCTSRCVRPEGCTETEGCDQREPRPYNLAPWKIWPEVGLSTTLWDSDSVETEIGGSVHLGINLSKAFDLRMAADYQEVDLSSSGLSASHEGLFLSLGPTLQLLDRDRFDLYAGGMIGYHFLSSELNDGESSGLDWLGLLGLEWRMNDRYSLATEAFYRDAGDVRGEDLTGPGLRLGVVWRPRVNRVPTVPPVLVQPDPDPTASLCRSCTATCQALVWAGAADRYYDLVYTGSTPLTPIQCVLFFEQACQESGYASYLFQAHCEF